MGDGRTRTLGDSWQHAIGNVIAALVFLFNFYWLYRHGVAGMLPDGADPVVDRRAERRTQSPPCKELVSCLSLRVV